MGRVTRMVARSGARFAGDLAAARVSDPDAVRESFQPAPDWRELDADGYARRLGPRETIAPAGLTGHWRYVDAREPYVGWRSRRKAAGLGLWALAVAGAAGLGWWRGRGPLASLSELDRFGEAFDGLEGFGGRGGDGELDP